MILIDTNFLIYLSKAQNKASEFIWRQLEAGQKFCISPIILIEFLSYVSISENEKKFFFNILGQFTFIELNMAIALKAVDLRKQYHLKLGDSIIAATAITQNVSLLSYDEDFAKVKELKMVNI